MDEIILNSKEKSSALHRTLFFTNLHLLQGLPREIELRRKQYEYYRERLLSFDNNKIDRNGVL